MRGRAWALLLFLAPVLRGDDWPQWGRNAEHTSFTDAVAQPLDAILADVVFDPFVAQEKAESGGDLLAHFPSPLVEGDSVYMGFKSGVYRSCDPPGSGQPAPCGPDAWDTQTWGVKKLLFTGGALSEVWSLNTDWKPVPNGPGPHGWEPVFQPALTQNFLWVPGASGSVLQVSKDSGRVIGRVEPFPRGSLDIFVASGIAADPSGDVYYTVLALESGSAWSTDAAGSWLVRVSPSGQAVVASFATLLPGAPRGGDSCRGAFVSEPLPWPPGAAALPPLSPCGSQRAALNAIPAIGADGTIYVVSRAHLNDRYGYVVAANPDLSVKWAASLRGQLADGCGVFLGVNGGNGGCRAGASPGVDPETNEAPAGRPTDESSSSPVALPDGGVVYGAYTRYNSARGHLFRFTRDGQFAGAYDFGWDITPAVFPHAGTYSIVLKDNHYDIGSYCDNPTYCPVPTPLYALTQLGASLKPEWSYINTTAQECLRGDDGRVSCTALARPGFEWCVNQPAIDASGIVHANAEDGFVYAIGQGGVLVQSLFLNQALGAAYTPLAVGGDGLVFAENSGHLFVVGRAPAR